jgi:hypothetical protein
VVGVGDEQEPAELAPGGDDGHDHARRRQRETAVLVDQRGRRDLPVPAKAYCSLNGAGSKRGLDGSSWSEAPAGRRSHSSGWRRRPTRRVLRWAAPWRAPGARDGCRSASSPTDRQRRPSPTKDSGDDVRGRRSLVSRCAEVINERAAAIDDAARQPTPNTAHRPPRGPAPPTFKAEPVRNGANRPTPTQAASACGGEDPRCLLRHCRDPDDRPPP